VRTQYRYPWPASRLDSDLMACLYRVREAGSTRVPITELVRRAVLTVYATQGCPAPDTEAAADNRREAA